ncbi:hypothetical protein FRC08_006743 [Ceratobasidium sp. 394]|nr:hypothetical protein FRC08_006743 [Ceratobasidium sp. 394]
MILDAEHCPKLPIPWTPGSQTQSPVLPTHFSPLQHHASYSTFPRSDLLANAQYTDTASDITALLGYHSPEFLSDGEQPPAYDEVSTPRRLGNRFWTRCATIVLT